MPFSATAVWTAVVALLVIGSVFVAQRYASRRSVNTGRFEFNVWLTATWILALFVIGEFMAGIVWWAHWSNGVLWGLGLGLCGFLFGFIFAIPKSATSSGPSVQPNLTSSGRGLRANTNLEEISDWLTKILVGVSLIQVKNLPDYIGNLAQYMVKDNDGVSVSAGISMIVTFCPWGFLAGYLLTRTFFSGIIATADVSLQSDADALLRLHPLPHSPETQIELTPDARAAAQSVANLTPAAAENANLSLDALTVAQLGVGQPAAALTTIEAALAKDASNVRLHYLRALALRDLGRLDEAVASLNDARQKLSPSSEKSLREAVYNSLTHFLLYVSPPAGFTRAIDICEEFLRQDPAGIGGSILVNLACAHGQAARFYRSDVKLFAEHREKALDAVNRAVQIDPKWLPRLRTFLHPSDDQKRASEDDLNVFEGDPDFEKLLTGRG